MPLFNRTVLTSDNSLPRPSRAGDGFMDNVRVTVLTDAAQTLTIAQLSGGALQASFAAARNLTVPTGAQIAAACPGMDIGDSFCIMVSMISAFAATYVANTGVTLAGRTTTPASSNSTIVVTRTGAATFEWRVL